VTDSQQAAPPPAPAPAPPAPVKSGNVPGLIAVIAAGVAFLTSFVVAGSTWFFAVGAIVFAIIALVQKRQPKWMALVAIIVAPIAWIIAIIVVVASIATGVGAAIDDAADAPVTVQTAPAVDEPTDDPSEEAAPAEEEPAEEEPAEEEPATDEPSEEPAEESSVGIGDTVTNDDDVSFTVTKVTCGLDTVGEQFLEEEAKGEFCEVKFTMANGSKDSVNVSSSDVTAQIGDATYDSNATSNQFGGDYFLTDINPGLSADCVMYFDVAKGKKLDTVTFDPPFSLFTSAVVVDVS